MDARRGTRAGEHYRLLGADEAALHIACHACDSETSVTDQAAFGERAVRRLIAAGLPYAERPGGREVDGVELLNFCKASGDDAWRHGMLSEFRRMVLLYEERMEQRARGEPARARVVLRHRRRWFFHDRAEGAPIRLAFQLPVDDATRRTLSVEVTESGGARASVSEAAVVLRGKVPKERVLEAEVRIEALVDCEAPQPVADLVAPDLSPWLSMDEPGLPTSEPIRALARTWTAGRTEPVEQIRAIWDELGDRLRFGFLHPEDQALDPLALGWADCYTASALLVAMCRAVGIPARVVSGMFLLRERPSDYHFWMEAWLPDVGWAPFDWGASFGLAELPEDRERWRRWFFGRVDYRFVFARLPAQAFAATGAELPASWYRMDRGEGRTVFRQYFARDDRRPIFTDIFHLEELTWT